MLEIIKLEIQERRSDIKVYVKFKTYSNLGALGKYDSKVVVHDKEKLEEYYQEKSSAYSLERVPGKTNFSVVKVYPDPYDLGLLEHKTVQGEDKIHKVKDEEDIYEYEEYCTPSNAVRGIIEDLRLMAEDPNFSYKFSREIEFRCLLEALDKFWD